MDLDGRKHEMEILRGQLAAAQSELRRTNLVNSSSEEARQRLQEQLIKAQKGAAALSSQFGQTTSENMRFASENQRKNDLIADLRAQNDALSRQIADGLSDSVAQEARIQEMAESFERKKEDLERERQLAVVSNDARQLMGARNLHVIDVREVDGVGASLKPFGRIFYSEGQSLIFYAFDLPKESLGPAKYTFQAWGETSFLPRKLGTFKVDAREQRCWVLKVSDSGLLAGIDTVFVTSDSQIDAHEPHGKKLLYAYIGGQPNHP